MKKVLLFACSLLLGMSAMAQSVGDIITFDEKSYEVIGENLVTNGTFDDGFNGWTSANDWSSTLTSSKFKIDTDETNGNYLVGTVNEGSTAAGSIGTAWEIGAGKTYLFTYQIKALGDGTDTNYLKSSLTNTKGQETVALGTPSVTKGEWKVFEKVFTNSSNYKYLQVQFRWLSSQWGFDNFKIMEIVPCMGVEELNNLIDEIQALVDALDGDKTDINAAIQAAKNANPTTNLQIQQAKDALQSAYDTFYFTAALPKEGNTLDYTSLIGDIYNTGAWTTTTGAQNHSWKVSTEKNTEEYSATGFYENWNKDPFKGDITTIISNLREGHYTVSALAFDNVMSGVVSFTANTESVLLSTETNLFQQPTIDDVVVGENGTLKVGLHISEASTNWVGISTITLLYKGEVTQEEKDYATLTAIAQDIMDLVNATDVPTANIGEDAFQYDEENVGIVQDYKDMFAEATAADLVALVMSQKGDQAEAYLNAFKAGVLQDIEAMNTLNQPEEGQKFAFVLTYGGWNYDNKAITYIANERTDHGNYNIKYNSEWNLNYAQAFTMTWVEGSKYKMSQIDAEGKERFICTGVVYGGNTAQIRTTLDAEKALLVEVRASMTEEGKYNLWNTEAKNYIGSQDAGVFTVDSHRDFNIINAQPGKGDYIDILAENQYATICSPHAIHLGAESRITAVYSVDGVDENGATLVMTTLTLEDNTIPANTPVILFAENGATNQHAGWGTAYEGMPLTKGLLTGVYADTQAPANSYVLQNQSGVVGFYQVEEESVITVDAYKCYLTTPAESEARVLTFGEETAINAIGALTSGKAQIFDLNGRQLNSLQKGINIVNGVKILVK